MRTSIAIGLLSLTVWGCGSKNDAIEQAEKEHQAELKEAKDTGAVAKTLKPPVANRARLDCAKVIDTVAFTTALGEKDPITVRDDNGPDKDKPKADGDAAAVCSILRGGKRMTPAEQEAYLKKQARLGVMNGDPICQVSLYCWTFEDEEHLKKKCATDKDKDDASMDSYACMQVVATGQDDVDLFKFIDPDTKCLFKVGPGGSNIDNDMIRKCAKTARDSIGPAQITP